MQREKGPAFQGQSVVIYSRAAHLRECIDSLLRKQDAGYPVRFDNGKNTTEFGYSWEIIIAEN